MDKPLSPPSSPTASASTAQRHIYGPDKKEKKMFVYDMQRNKAKVVRRDSMSEAQTSKLQPVEIPKGSRRVDVKVGSQGEESSPRWANVNIATVELPTMVRLERKFTGNYQHLWVA